MTIIIAHRGASGYRPEHTIESYRLAAEMGADFLEPDLVITKDGHLVCRHENNIIDTTDVADRVGFEPRYKEKIIDGVLQKGFFTEDFTLEELKTLKCRERLPNLRKENTKYNDLLEIPTFEELLILREELCQKYNREIGVYPETKHPSYFKTQNLEFDDKLLRLLEKYNLNKKSSPVFIQSFETENLKTLSQKTEVKLIQLMQEEGGAWNNQRGITKTYKEMCSPDELKEIAKYAYGIGPQKTMIFPIDERGFSKAESLLVKDAHEAGLKLHPWTFRAENIFLAKQYQNDNSEWGNIEAEIKSFVDIGIDGIFCDFPDIAYKVIKELNYKKE